MALHRLHLRRLRFLRRANHRRRTGCTNSRQINSHKLKHVSSDANIRSLLVETHSEDESDCTDHVWTMPIIGKDARTADVGAMLDYEFRTCQVQLSVETTAQLIRSCRVRHAQGGSSWMPCGATPRCLPEALAAAIFTYHTTDAVFDKSRSGAEWWAQVRKDGNPKKAIKFHWDADEFAVEQFGVNIHPHLATVTYLTDYGAPTLVVDRRNPLKLDGVVTPCGSIQHGLLSYPRSGKHIVFDGQFLHGNVPGLGEEGERTTFLVNVWLNHRPSNCNRLPRVIGQYLGSPAAAAALTPLLAPGKVIRDPYEHMLKIKFAWRTQFLSLCVPLPLNCDTAVMEWTHGADLCNV